MGANLRILSRNILPSNNSLSLSVGLSAVNYPLSNLIHPRKYKTWRSTDLSLPTIAATWSSAQTIDCIVLPFTNFITGTEVRTRLYDSEVGGSLLYDSGNVVITHSITPPSPFTTLGLPAFPFGGGIHFSHFFEAVSGVRRLSVQLNSSGNPDGYTEISYLLTGLSFEPTDNADYGASYAFTDSTESTRTVSGESVTSRGAIVKRLSFTISRMSAQDQINIFKLFKQLGLSQPMFCSVIPKAPIDDESLSFQIYGKLAEDFVTTLEDFEQYTTDIQLVEI